MRRDIEFRTEDGVTLRGWHYLPDAGEAPFPTIIMAPGLTMLKEMFLDRFGENFAQAGLASIIFDNRNFGDSEGLPRQEADPWVQIRDYRDAITFAETLPEVDAARIGVWGSGYAGSHAIVVGATDRRVKAVVSQVPMISGYKNLRHVARPHFITALEAAFERDRRRRWSGEDPAMIAVVTADPAAPALMPTPDAWACFTDMQASHAPTWRNEVTLRTVEMTTAYEPGSYIGFVSPTPLLMLVALTDHVTAAETALAAYEKALHPKKLIALNGGHFDPYGVGFDFAAAKAAEWFNTYLGRI